MRFILVSLALLLLLLSGCAGKSKKEVHLCVLRPALNACFESQEQGLSKRLDEVDGWFAVSPEDLSKILSRPANSVVPPR